MIGIFDSGSGGLTVLKEIKKQIPRADIVYFGDIKNAPYGNRSSQELSQLTARSIEFLTSKGATNIVSACNSVSASVVLSMLDILGVSQYQFTEMVGPTVSACKERKEENILLTATAATIDSKIYQNSFELVGKKIDTLAIPELAGAIERGVPQDEIRGIIENSMRSRREADVCILGCTHYPLVENVFRDVLGRSVEIFDPAHSVAERVKEKYVEEGEGKLTFCISEDSDVFRSRVENMFGEEYTIEVV